MGLLVKEFGAGLRMELIASIRISFKNNGAATSPPRFSILAVAIQV